MFAVSTGCASEAETVMKRGLARALVPSTQTPYLPRNRDLQEIATCRKSRLSRRRVSMRLRNIVMHIVSIAGLSRRSRISSWLLSTFGRPKELSTQTDSTLGTWKHWPGICAADSELLLATPHKLVDVNDASMDDAMPHDQSFYRPR